MLVSIILPTFNEKENIGDLILAIDKEKGYDKEIIVVDDDSPDGTSKIVQKMIDSQKIKGLKLETRKIDHGLTKSIWRGIEIAKGDVVVWLDCDFSMPPEKISDLVKKIEDGHDIAVGSRFVKSGGFKKNLKGTPDSWLVVTLSRLMNYTIQLFLDRRFRDYTSGFIAIKKDIVKKIKLRGDYGEYFIDLMVRAILLNYKFVEIPYECVPRQKGTSKTGSSLIKLFKRGIKYLVVAFSMFLLRLRYKLGFRNDIAS